MPPKRLSLFFSNGIGLSNWNRKGLLYREIALYRQLETFGWSSIFFTYDRTKNLPELPANIDVVSQWPFITPKRFNFLYELIIPLARHAKGKEASLIMTNQAYRGWPAVLAGKLWNRKLVARCGMVFGERTQGIQKREVQIRRFLEKFTFRNSDICIVPTHYHAEWIRDNYGINWGKIKIIPNYVDCDIFSPATAEKQKIDVLVVGRLENIKRHFLLLQAAKGSDWKLRFIGDGSLADKLRQYAIDNKIDLDMESKVPNQDLPNYYRDTKVFVLPSEKEGHPKALLEAMACGCACIGTNSPGIKNIIKNGQTGYLVDAEVASIRRAVDTILQNREMGKMLGRKAHQYVIANFSLEKIVKLYSGVFESLLNKN